MFQYAPLRAARKAGQKPGGLPSHHNSADVGSGESRFDLGRETESSDTTPSQAFVISVLAGYSGEGVRLGRPRAINQIGLTLRINDTMADTRTQRTAEQWIRDTWLPGVLQQTFRKQRVRLTPGGEFEFDAVSRDRRVIVTVSTSRHHTSSGGRGAGKLNKIRSDILFLTLAKARRRIVVLTESDMFRTCQSQKTAGRLPSSVEFLLAKIPVGLASRLRRARRRSAREVSPRGARA